MLDRGDYRIEAAKSILAGGSRSSIAPVTNHAGWYAYGHAVIGHRGNHKCAGSDDAVPANTGGHGCSFTDPGIAADCDGFIVSRLFAEWNVQTVSTMLTAAVHDRNMRSDQHIVLDRHIADRTVISDVSGFANGRFGMGENRSERDTRIFSTLTNGGSQKCMPQMNARKSRQQTKKL